MTGALIAVGVVVAWLGFTVLAITERGRVHRTEWGPILAVFRKFAAALADLAPHVRRANDEARKLAPLLRDLEDE